MAFNSASLSALTYANGFTLWHYRTPDGNTDVDTAGYFNAASAMVRVGDFIFANCSVTATPTNGVFVVTTNTGGVVDVSNMSPFGSANSD